MEKVVKATTSNADTLQKPYTIQYKTGWVFASSSKTEIARPVPTPSVLKIGMPHVVDIC